MMGLRKHFSAATKDPQPPLQQRRPLLHPSLTPLGTLQPLGVRIPLLSHLLPPRM